MVGARRFEKYSLFANLKKWHFYKNEVCLLGYVILSQKIIIEDEKIEIVKN